MNWRGQIKKYVVHEIAITQDIAPCPCQTGKIILAIYMTQHDLSVVLVCDRTSISYSMFFKVILKF